MAVSAASMAAHTKPVAVLLDALGTLLRFEPPAPHLRAALRRAHGRRHRRGRRARGDPRRDRLLPRAPARGLATRRRCTTCASAAPRRWRLPLPRPRVVLDALLASLRFYAYPRQRARRCARCAAPGSGPSWSPTGTGRCTSGSPRPGSRALVDGAIASAEVGSAKPDGAIFRGGARARGRRRGGRVARRRHARGRRRGRPRGRAAPDPDRPRRARRRSCRGRARRSDRSPSSYPWRCPDDEPRASRPCPSSPPRSPRRHRWSRSGCRSLALLAVAADRQPRRCRGLRRRSRPPTRRFKSTDDLPDGAHVRR